MTTYLGSSAVNGTPGVEGDNTAGGLGVFGKSMTGTSAGVQGNAAAGIGVYGTATTGTAILGENGQVSVLAKNYAASGYGLQSWTTGDNAVGLFVQATGLNAAGGHFEATNTSGGGQALYARTYSATGLSAAFYGGYGMVCTSVAGPTAASFLNGAPATSGSSAVVAWCSSPGNAFYAQGNSYVTGYLTKAGGGYRIDHPTDPENKFLNHCFVESPEMKNVYDGVVMLDAAGSANITMPSYFEAANSDYRYQLTAIGAPMPDLHVSVELSKGQFSVAGGKAGKKVSWQVTGIRADKWALANHPGIEIDKTPEEKGFFMHPELHGFGIEKNLHPSTRALPKDPDLK